MNSRQINPRAGSNSNFSPNLNPSSSFSPVFHTHNGPTFDMNHYQTNTCANSSSSPNSRSHAYPGYNSGSRPIFTSILHPNSVNVTHGHGVHPQNIFHQQGSGVRPVTTRLPAAFTRGPSLEHQNQLLQAHVNRLSTALGQANQENKRLRRLIAYQHEVLAARVANQAVHTPTPAVASAPIPTPTPTPAPVPASVPAPPSAPTSPEVIDLSGESSPAIPEPRTPSPAPRATPRCRKAAPGWMRTQASDGLIGAIYAGPVKKAEPVLPGPCQTGKGQAASKVVKKVKQVKKSRKALEEGKKAKKAYEEVIREKEREEREKKEEEEKRVEAEKSQEEADIERLWQEYEEGSGSENEAAGKPVEEAVGEVVEEALPNSQFLAPEEEEEQEEEEEDDDDDSLFGESEVLIVEDP